MYNWLFEKIRQYISTQLHAYFAQVYRYHEGSITENSNDIKKITQVELHFNINIA